MNRAVKIACIARLQEVEALMSVGSTLEHLALYKPCDYRDTLCFSQFSYLRPKLALCIRFARWRRSDDPHLSID